jgi:hypothetical protein
MSSHDVRHMVRRHLILLCRSVFRIEGEGRGDIPVILTRHSLRFINCDLNMHRQQLAMAKHVEAYAILA